MKKLKEYAGVIVALVTVMTALASLGLWAIHVQITPEIRRLDGRIESLADRVDRRIESLADRVDRMDARWEARFNRIEGDIKTIENDVKTILLRLPKQKAAS